MTEDSELESLIEDEDAENLKQQAQRHGQRFTPRDYDANRDEREAGNERMSYELGIDFIDSREEQGSVFDELGIPAM